VTTFGIGDSYETGETDAEKRLTDAIVRNQTAKLANSWIATGLKAVTPEVMLPGPQSSYGLNYIPGLGVAQQLAGFAGQVIDYAGRGANAIDRWIGIPRRDGQQLPAGDPADEVSKHYEASRRAVQEKIGEHTPLPAPDPNGVFDPYVDATGAIFGGVTPVVPAKVGEAIARAAPLGFKTAAGLVLPSTHGLDTNIGIASVLGAHAVGSQAALDIADHLEAQPAQVATAQPATTPAPDAATVPAPDATTTAAPDPATVPAGPNVQVAANANPNTATDVGFSGVFGNAPPSAPPTRRDALGLPPIPANDPTNLGFTGAMNGQTGSAVPPLDATGYGDHTILKTAIGITGLLAGLGAVKMLHGNTRVITDAERAARFNDPAYAQAAADYNASVIKRGTNVSAGLTAPAPPPTPEHNAVRQGMNYANDKLLNSNAQMQDFIRMNAEPTEAEALAHQYGNVHNQMRLRAKLGQFLETGYDPETGVQTVAHNDVYRDIAKLDDTRKQILAEGLFASNEQNNRASNRTAFARDNPGVTPKPEDIRHDLGQLDDNAVAAARAKMMNDPELAELANRFRAIPFGLVQIGEKHGFFTQAEARRLITEHPDYLPEVKDGLIVHPFGRRDKTISTGVEQMNVLPWDAMAQHTEELMRQFQLNSLNQKLRQSFMDTQRDFPNSAQFMRDVPAPSNNQTFYTGGSFRDPIIAVRTPTGTKFTRIEHPDVLNAFTGGSLTKNRINVGVLGLLKQWTQYWTTGVGSLATGGLAPVTNALYTIPSLAINTPRNMYAGPLDRAMQQTTGRTSGVLRALDIPNNLVGVPLSYARGVADRAYNRFGMGNLLGNMVQKGNSNPINDILRSHLGDARVDMIEQAMRDYWLNTKTYKMEADLGLGGQGIPTHGSETSLGMQNPNVPSTLAAHMVPQLFSQGMFGAKPILIHLNRIIGEAMGHLSEAGHDYSARLNWDNPNISKDTLAYETRNLTGDPAVRGSSRALGAVTDLTPYANIGMQGTARMGRAFVDDPRLTAATVASSMGAIVAAELLSHMRSPQHMQYYNDQLSTQQQASGIVLATNDDPTKPTIINLAQEYRAFHAVAKAFMSNLLNTIALHHDPDWYHNVRDTLIDFFGSHITHTAEDAALHGVIDATDFVNLPAVAGHMDWFKYLHGKSLLDSYRSPVSGTTGSLPNQVPDGLLDDKQGKVMESLLKAGFGGLATVYDFGRNTSRYAKQTGSWIDGMGMATHDWLQGFQDRNPKFNTLYEHQLRLAQESPIAEATQRQIDALSAVTGARTAERDQGMTGRGRYAQEVPMSVETRLPSDPTMRQMYNIASAYKTRMAGPETEIAQIKKQMGAWNAQGMDNDTKRTWMNDRTRDLADKYRHIHAMMSDLDYALSTAAGRPVHIENIKWDKGMEQFAR
jgi:hypothetical protein